MNGTIGPTDIAQIHNPNAAPETPYGPALEAILHAEGLESARRDISGWPGYAPTPLHCLAGLAAAAGVAESGTRTRAAASAWAASRRWAALIPKVLSNDP